MRFGVWMYDGVEPIDLAAFGVPSMAQGIRPGIEICRIAPQGRLLRRPYPFHPVIGHRSVALPGASGHTVAKSLPWS
jgi:hypothetical protein